MRGKKTKTFKVDFTVSPNTPKNEQILKYRENKQNKKHTSSTKTFYNSIQSVNHNIHFTSTSIRYQYVKSVSDAITSKKMKKIEKDER